MNPVRTYEEFSENLKDKYNELSKIVCILFLDPSHDEHYNRYFK